MKDKHFLPQEHSVIVNWLPLLLRLRKEGDKREAKTVHYLG